MKTTPIYVKKFIVREISEDGIVKKIKGGLSAYRDFVCDDEYISEEDAIVAIEKEGIYGAIILPFVTRVWN